MKVAVVGCAHGELDKIYESIRHVEETEQIRVDLVICCGDFQAVRNYDDLSCMAVPPVYRQLNTFYKYYSGQFKAPYLTLFVGGNHEASNYLTELPYGGWVAPRIYYLGYANVVQIGDVRIAGLSGIYKAQHYFQGHFECPPYNEDTKRSAYHVRQMDVFRLKQLKPNAVDIFISHDWPRGIHRFGNEAELFRVKPYFRDEAQRGVLGNPSTEDLLFLLKPKYWFAAHMHVKFPALVEHEDGSQTKYLALDKCLPRREFMQILDVGSAAESPDECDLKYDLEWLAILKSTNHLCSTSNRTQYMPGPTPGSEVRYQFTPTEEEINGVADLFDRNLVIPLNFQWTAPPLFEPGAASGRHYRQKFYVNPQTQEFCTKLGVTNTNELLAKLRPIGVEEAYCVQCEKDASRGPELQGNAEQDKSESGKDENPDEIQLGDEDDGDSGPSGTAAEDTNAQLQPEILNPQAAAGSKRCFEFSDSDHTKSEGTTTASVGTTEHNAEDGSSVLKRFKRRNADLYADSEDVE